MLPSTMMSAVRNKIIEAAMAYSRFVRYKRRVTIIEPIMTMMDVAASKGRIAVGREKNSGRVSICRYCPMKNSNMLMTVRVTLYRIEAGTSIFQ